MADAGIGYRIGEPDSRPSECKRQATVTWRIDMMMGMNSLVDLITLKDV
jgi:hypothetical protein